LAHLAAQAFFQLVRLALNFEGLGFLGGLIFGFLGDVVYGL
jgi:hypothetical protein